MDFFTTGSESTTTTTTSTTTTTITNTITTTAVTSTCVVKEYKSGEEKLCVFPFTLINDGLVTIYDNCTDVLDEDGRYWCSTKVHKP